MRTPSIDLKPKKAGLPLSGKRGTDPSKDTDQLLWRVLEHDDYSAFEKLFYLNYNPLRNFCKKLVVINEVAEELVSEVFFKIWNNRKRIVISSSPKSYLYTAVRNIAFDHLRKEKHSVWADLEEASAKPCDSFDPQMHSEFLELQDSVERAVAKLPKQCRLVFQLSRDHGMKYSEIAETLHLSVKTIETQMGRALKSLRRSLIMQEYPVG
jgi:RNA polymerase sigma-70 factor, ECF subfamily